MTFVSVLLFNIFERKPFKFENFKTAEEVKAYLDEHYLTRNASKILEDLSIVGATYIERRTKIAKHEMVIEIDGDYEKVYVGRYRNNFISSDPLSMYIFSLYVDKNKKLVGVFVKKESKIEFP